jgi:hypothetical protein
MIRQRITQRPDLAELFHAEIPDDNGKIGTKTAPAVILLPDTGHPFDQFPVNILDQVGNIPPG